MRLRAPRSEGGDWVRLRGTKDEEDKDGVCDESKRCVMKRIRMG